MKTIGIIGYGRFGSLWASVMERDFNVLVTDKLPISDARAVPLADLCARSDAIFLCVPINQFDDVVQSIAAHLRPGTVVFDTCSVKLFPAETMQARLGHIDSVSLIATHPMFGPDSAANGVAGLPMAVWPVQASSEVFEEWVRTFEQLGIRTVRMAPDEHDRLAAYSQGVTHYIGRVLEQLQLEPTPIDTAGFKILYSLIEQTCNDSWELFHDLQTYNPFTQEMRSRIEEALESLNERL